MCWNAAGDDGKVVMQRDRIAVHYIKGWFLFDVVSSLPYEQMVHQGNHGIPTMSIVALLKVRAWALWLPVRQEMVNCNGS